MTTNARLKITDIKIVQLRVIEEVGSIEPAWDVGGSMPITSGGGSIVEIHTDQGLVGIGPGIDPSLLDAAKACLVGEDPFDMERHVGKTYNVGGGLAGSVSLRELTDLCEAVTGNRIEIASVPETRPADIPLYITDNRKVTEATGWRPKIAPKDILVDIFAWEIFALIALIKDGVFNDYANLKSFNEAFEAQEWFKSYRGSDRWVEKGFNAPFAKINN